MASSGGIHVAAQDGSDHLVSAGDSGQKHCHLRSEDDTFPDVCGDRNQSGRV